MDDDMDARLRGPDKTKEDLAAIAAKALAFDPARYRHHLAHLNMSEDAQAELLDVLWRMMGSFVDRAFGDDPTQLALKAGDSRKLGRDRLGANALSSPSSTETEHDPAHATIGRVVGHGD